MSPADRPADAPADRPAAPASGVAAPDATAEPAPVDWSEESTAGEEDPGASLDMAVDPPSRQQPPETPPPAPGR